MTILLQIAQIFVVLWLIWVFLATAWILWGAALRGIFNNRWGSMPDKWRQAYCDAGTMLTFGKLKMSYFEW